MKSLKARLLLRSVIGFIALAAVFFLAAGTLKFWQAWTFLGSVFTVWTFAAAHL